MTVNGAPVGWAGDESASNESLEWLTDDEWWTLVPVDATEDERLTQWISVQGETLCELEEWR